MNMDIAKPPSIAGARRALFIQPHPDDNEIGAGGTMARLAENGCEVYELTVTDGRFGIAEPDISIPDAIEIRKKEAIHAMVAIGAKNAGFLGFSDQTPASISDIASEITKIIEAIEPDVVFSVDPDLRMEWHDDHIKVGRAVSVAIRNSKHKPLCLAYYFTDDANTDFDITAHYARKIEAIRCHKSQISDAFLALLELYFRKISEGTCFEHAERIKVFTEMHTHCWTLPFDHVSY